MYSYSSGEPSHMYTLVRLAELDDVAQPSKQLLVLGERLKSRPPYFSFRSPERSWSSSRYT